MASLRTVIAVLLGFLHVGEGGNILIFSGYGEGSHFMTAALVGKELMHRGNNVTVLISNAYEHRVNETKYKDLNFEIFKHNVPPEEVRMRLERFTESIFEGTWLTDVMSNLTVLTGEMADDCHALFNDEALLQRLLQAKFDVAFVDPIWPCSLLVAEYAAKRHVSFMATAWMNDIARVNGNPSNTAFVPEMNTGFTNKMTFIQRIINSIVVMLSMWLNVFTDGYTQIQHAHGICPDLQPFGGLSSGPANSLNQNFTHRRTSLTMASLRTVIVVLLGFLHVGEGGNILIFSGYGEGSHFMTAALVGKELMHRGNNVTVLISNAYEHRVNETKYKDLNFEIFKHIVPPEEVRMRLERFTESIFKGTWLTDVMSNLTVLTGEMADDCHALFNDEALLQRLLQAKFDVAFVDPIWPCSLLVAEYAAKRHVSFMATAWMNDIARVNGNPSNTAFVPEMNTGFTNKMTFIQRIINSIVVMLSMWLNVFTDGYTQIQHAHGICPDLQPSELYKRSQLLLVNVDFALEFSIPIMPHLIPVGGLSSGPANSLNQDLEEYARVLGCRDHRLSPRTLV
eukprot:XP_011674902.1 PREDICTED: 2-hydroxyacylsphingosine 1-beta-galactosyltransferase-like [Strongylocentrotus purpuratus]